ncbi:PUTATIVE OXIDOREDUCTASE PROTEIN(EC:1.-) [Alloactinosynnema sp. L-07]|uniref:SDR family oxidoreductase n=1 Tax=Alloactinosynnema sp. L-07 TaxID=1653480 RepID=UPI00065F0670|nr:SDR family oxidoreductase [Alloactinosynnema sp. L-07]CRK61001.1 PUTATIVE OXIDOREDUCTASE PROTEIN(EC:1.-) [Alloactinosynnema sp. L-07]
MGTYTDKTAVISGGTHGIGLATAKAVIEGGGRVIVTGRNKDTVDKAAAELGPQAIVVRSDTTVRTDIDALVELVQGEFGRTDLVFVNAGVAELGPVGEVDEAAFDRIFDVNTKGAFFTAQGLAPLVVDGGAIVFTTVTDGTAAPGMTVYLASKAAVRSFAKGFAVELVGRGVRVSTVAPGYTDTPTMGVAGLTAAERADFMAAGDAIIPMRRHATAEEVAKAVLFLGFDATYSTGVELAVDGGLAQINSPTDI